MRYIHILTELWCKPWLITPEMHGQLCRIVQAHLENSAEDTGQYPARERSRLERVDNYAIMPIRGVIARGIGKVERASGVTDEYDISAMVDEALADDSIKGVLMDIDSPGGTTGGTPELAEKLFSLAMQKPVVAWTDNLIASAAYWLAAQAHAIYATPSAMVGCIGVYSAWLDTSREFEMKGYRMELFKRGKYKAMGLEGTQLTDEQRELLQERVDTFYDWFVEAVTANRDIIPNALEGQAYIAQVALENNTGLIDATGTREDAIAELNDMIDAMETDTTG